MYDIYLDDQYIIVFLPNDKFEIDLIYNTTINSQSRSEMCDDRMGNVGSNMICGRKGNCVRVICDDIFVSRRGYIYTFRLGCGLREIELILKKVEKEINNTWSIVSNNLGAPTKLLRMIDGKYTLDPDGTIVNHIPVHHVKKVLRDLYGRKYLLI